MWLSSHQPVVFTLGDYIVYIVFFVRIQWHELFGSLILLRQSSKKRTTRHTMWCKDFVVERISTLSDPCPLALASVLELAQQDHP